MYAPKRIFITGATSGVGYEIAKQLIHTSHELWLTGRNEAILNEWQQQGAHIIPADLTDDHQRKHLIQNVPEVDVAILNAGVGTFSYAQEIKDEDIDAMIALNVTAPMKLTKELLPIVKEQFIFIGSQAGKVATPKASVYAATKFALIGYTNALRLEQPNKVITVIHPGPIDSPFLDHADATNTYRQKMGRVLLSAEEVAKKTIQTIGTKKRECNIPWYMGISSKLYALAPSIVETIGKPFFNKK